MNLGLPQFPEWLIRSIFYLAVIGALTLFAGFIGGVYYLITHLHWN